MCRNITTLRGLEPDATPEEIEAAARQFVRKIGGTDLLAELPARKQPPKTLPPLRRMHAAH